MIEPKSEKCNPEANPEAKPKAKPKASRSGKAPPADPEGRSFGEVGHKLHEVSLQRRAAEARDRSVRVPTFDDFEALELERGRR